VPAPGSISGPSTVCQGDTGKIYSVNPVAGATGYHWNVPAGVIITSGNNTNIITVTYTATSVSGSFSVNAYTSICNGTISPPFPVTVNPTTIPTLTGPDSLCAGSTGNIYSTEAGMLNYIWTVSSGGTITAGGTASSNTVTVTWNVAGPQQVMVLYTNSYGCKALNPTSYNVTVEPLPGSTGNITGASLICAGAAGLVYTVSPVTGAISYVWTLPPGFSIVSGNGTNAITVDVATGASLGTILVYATNSCGPGPSSPPFPVVIITPPTGNAGPDGSTCQTNPFTVTQASASDYIAYHWHSSGHGVFTDTATLSPTYTPAQGETGPVTLTLIIYGNAPCGKDSSKMILTVEPKATVNAGSELNTCGQNSVQIKGSSASDYQSLLWTTTGSGVFDDPAILHPTYTPGISDINDGSVSLTLHATSTEPCEPDSDRVLLTISKPVYVNAGPDSSVCQDQAFTLNKAIASSYSKITWLTTGDGTFNDSTIVNPVYTPGNSDLLQGNTVLRITAEGIYPCSPGTDSLVLTINRKPTVHPGPDGAICQGMTFQVTGVTASDYSNFIWGSNGRGALSGTTTLSPIYTPSPGETGTVIMTLNVFGKLSCSDSMVSCQMSLKIYYPVIVNAGKDQTIAYNTVAILQAEANGGTGNYTYEWQPAALVQDDTARETQTLSLKNDTVFIVTVTDKVTGCSATDSIKIFTGPGEGLDSCIVVHNVITPNGDGLNDTWIIDCIENYPDNNVQIFNMWGDRVNKFDHYDNTTQVWKGTNYDGKLLPAGTYYYVLQIKNEKTRTGWILLRGGLN
jgi:gliding motility-associated-like protein